MEKNVNVLDIIKKIVRLRVFIIMKLTVFFICFSVLSSIASGIYSQSSKISLNLNQTSIKYALKEIENTTNYYFLYNNNMIDVDKTVSVKISNKSIEEVLDQLFQGEDVKYMVMDRQIIITPTNMDNQAVFSQGKVTGQVTDNDGNSLPGVTVVIKGTTTGTITDLNGNYTIEAASDDVLVFSFVGMQSVEQAVDGRSQIDVTLSSDVIGLEEVVAIGYGTARRKDIAGSVSSVDIEDSPISQLPNTNIMQSLRGTTPGLNIAPSNAAGATPSIRVRGQNSISGSNDPLIVLDGVVYLGSLNDINPNDIATIDILKDASSTAIYGSRAANGVLIVTTKKGKKDKPVFKINSSYGVNVWQQKPDLMDGETFMQKLMALGGFDNPEAALNQYPAGDAMYQNYQNGQTVDWMDLASRTGQYQDHQLSVSGMGKGVNYFISTGYMDQQGVIVGDDYERVSLRGKLDLDVTDWFTLGVDGMYNHSDYSGVQANVYYSMTQTPLGLPYVDGSNRTQLEKYPIGESDYHLNPLWGTDGTIDDTDKQNAFRLASYFNIDVPFIKGLNYRLNYVRTGKYNIRDQFTHESYYVAFGVGMDRYSEQALQGNLVQANGYSQRFNDNSYVLDNILSYKNMFGDHYINATLAATRDHYYSKYVTITGSDFSSAGNTTLGVDGLPLANIQNYTLPADPDDAELNVIEKANVGYLARIGYAYKDKYHLSASIRRDGSSVFGEDRKWGTFPSVGVAWTVTEEDFLKNNSTLNYLKVRLSYGKNGNQGLGPYETLSKVLSGAKGGVRYEFADEPSKILYGSYISELGNPELGWETTTSLNGGFESSMFDNKVALSGDFYWSKTEDQIFEKEIPVMTGFTSIWTSLGQVNNWGLELSINSTNYETKDFKWTSTLSYWMNRNSLEKLYGDDIDGDGVEDNDISAELFIGEPLWSIYGYNAIGIVQENDTEYMENTGAQPGDVMFEDLNDDDKITAEKDRKILGHIQENFKMSFSNNFKYKNFDLYFLLSGTFGGNGYFQAENAAAYLFDTNISARNELNHDWWTADNPSNKYPRAGYSDDRYLGLQSRGYVRIQDISLSYSFNNMGWVQQLNLQNLKVFASVKNLYTFTNWDGTDPELGYGALRNDDDNNPVPTVYSIGLNVSF